MTDASLPLSSLANFTGPTNAMEKAEMYLNKYASAQQHKPGRARPTVPSRTDDPLDFDEDEIDVSLSSSSSGGTHHSNNNKEDKTRSDAVNKRRGSKGEGQVRDKKPNNSETEEEVVAGSSSPVYGVIKSASDLQGISPSSTNIPRLAFASEGPSRGLSDVRIQAGGETTHNNSRFLTIDDLSSILAIPVPSPHQEAVVEVDESEQEMEGRRKGEEEEEEEEQQVVEEESNYTSDFMAGSPTHNSRDTRAVRFVSQDSYEETTAQAACQRTLTVGDSPQVCPLSALLTTHTRI